MKKNRVFFCIEGKESGFHSKENLHSMAKCIQSIAVSVSEESNLQMNMTVKQVAKADSVC